MVCHRLLLHITVSYGMFCYGMLCYVVVWYGMVMLAGRLWSDYVRPVPSLPSPLLVPVTYVTPEHNADSVTTTSPTSDSCQYFCTYILCFKEPHVKPWIPQIHCIASLTIFSEQSCHSALTLLWQWLWWHTCYPQKKIALIAVIMLILLVFWAPLLANVKVCILKHSRSRQLTPMLLCVRTEKRSGCKEPSNLVQMSWSSGTWQGHSTFL